jgi:hypothetical protein
MRRVCREKNLKKQQDKQKSQGREGNPLSRNLNDSAALAEKIARKQALMKEQEEEAARVAAAQTKTKKKSENLTSTGLDDLLNAGLVGVKKK